MKEEYVVGGYLFSSEKDAALAREELGKIEYLDANMNYSNAAKVRQLYDRALDNNMFRTPVGWDYMARLREILSASGYTEEEIRPVQVYAVFSGTEPGADLIAPKVRPRAVKADPYKKKFTFAMMIIVVLVITVGAMFVIAMTSDTPNMLNYRNAIVNEYAEWEQDIKDRETTVREKERELGLPSPLPHEEQQEAASDTEDHEDE